MDYRKIRQASVSNPSRDYSAFLLYRSRSLSSTSQSQFQTLPGIILHFYRSPVPGIARQLSAFQTLPGIILHFYFCRCACENCRQDVSNPSRDYSAFLQKCLHDSIQTLLCFKPFQGLFCISTNYFSHGLFAEEMSFKPFQGLFCISTL